MPAKNPAPEDSPNRHRDIIAQFRDEFATTLAVAERNATLTETPGWQALIAEERADDRKERRSIAKGLRFWADELEAEGPTPDLLKAIGAEKRRATENHRRRRTFETNTIEPVRKPVRQCEEIVERFRQKAQQQEEAAPLHEAGLHHLMLDAIAAQPRPRWDDETGQLFVDPPKAP